MEVRLSRRRQQAPDELYRAVTDLDGANDDVAAGRPGDGTARAFEGRAVAAESRTNCRREIGDPSKGLSDILCALPIALGVPYKTF
ncbi:MAG: hypothetical protein ACI8UR_001879 [Natronomonas sp.]|jgi:hypothetical protein